MRDDLEAQEFQFSGFSWNNEKAENNWKIHGLDFEGAQEVFQEPVAAAPQCETGE